MQEKIDIEIEKKLDTVDSYEFEPIKGYPMLRWAGKRPFTSTQYYPAQLKEVHGQETDGWLNKIFWGDNLQVMSHLLKEYRGKVDLIYIDPPFDSKADYKKKISIKGIDVKNDHMAFEEKQYTDMWSNDEYLQFMYERIILLRELLSDKGSFFLHCDWRKIHHLRAIMDEIFGAENVINEIIWYYSDNFQGNVNGLATNHNNILWYSKTKKYISNKLLIPLPKPVKRDKRIWSKEEGKVIAARDDSGNLIYETYTHKKADDVWQIGQTSVTKSRSKEFIEYPTQKPKEILKRIIELASNRNDLVFDCFMGSGTTQAVALELGRKYIGADINLGAIQTTTKRLISVAKELNEQIQDEKKYTGFEVYNVNQYDIFRNELEAKELLKEALEIQPLPANNVYDGEKDGRMVKIMPINRIATRADLNELITNFDYKRFEKRQSESLNAAVESLLLVCMGHEPDLAAHLQKEVPYKLDIEVVDILRDKSNLEFKRDSEAEIKVDGDKLIIEQFYPMNLLQKLSIMKENVENVEDWKGMVESVMIDFNYDGAVFTPTTVDVPDKKELVKGVYSIPSDSGTIKVKITDLLSESLEIEING